DRPPVAVRLLPAPEADCAVPAAPAGVTADPDVYPDGDPDVEAPPPPESMPGTPLEDPGAACPPTIGVPAWAFSSFE
ncbi:MAG TPA: hypothetical protein VFV02_08555, partial [Acidimicrobiales bacterium]|nr:hypothetical protein [Acidimicrobiales bacterium]